MELQYRTGFVESVLADEPALAVSLIKADFDPLECCIQLLSAKTVTVWTFHIHFSRAPGRIRRRPTNDGTIASSNKVPVQNSSGSLTDYPEVL